MHNKRAPVATAAPCSRVITDRAGGEDNAIGRVRPYIRRFTLKLLIQLTFDLDILLVYGS